MRILYIYHIYRNRKKKYGDDMAKLGHKVFFIRVEGKSKPNQVNKEVIKKYEPDIVWILSPFYIQNNVISKETVEIIKQKNILLVVCSTFNTQIAYNEMDSLWKVFDFFFVRNKEFCNYLKGIGVNAYYIPIGFYPNYYPIKRDKIMKISFAGSPQTTVPVEKDKRVLYLKALDCFDVKVFGKDFNKRGITASSYNTHSRENEIYAQSKINLDLPFINSNLKFYENKYHLKNRFFEIPASGNFLMTVRCEEFLELLDETMVGYFDGNIDAMIETVAKYLKDEKEREKMAMKAYKEIINNHTQMHRFKQMFDIIGKI